MTQYLSATLKRDLQQNYRRFQDHCVDLEAANKRLNHAKAGKLWIVGVIALLFSMHSEFFLGVASALLAGHFYLILAAFMSKIKAEEAVEEVERWFSTTGVVFQDVTPFFKDDETLENPINLFQDSTYQ